MSTFLTNDNKLLQELLNKIMLYRFTRNIDRELENRKISHAALSRSIGRSGNWFNRSFNELEDMRISTFIKLIVSLPKISSHKNDFIQINSILDKELFEIASVLIDLKDNNLEHLLHPDANMTNFFLKIKVYLDSIKKTVSQEELDAYNRVLRQITQNGGEE